MDGVSRVQSRVRAGRLPSPIFCISDGSAAASRPRRPPQCAERGRGTDWLVASCIRPAAGWRSVAWGTEASWRMEASSPSAAHHHIASDDHDAEADDDERLPECVRRAFTINRINQRLIDPLSRTHPTNGTGPRSQEESGGGAASNSGRTRSVRSIGPRTAAPWPWLRIYIYTHAPSYGAPARRRLLGWGQAGDGEEDPGAGRQGRGAYLPVCLCMPLQTRPLTPSPLHIHTPTTHRARPPSSGAFWGNPWRGWSTSRRWGSTWWCTRMGGPWAGRARR